MTLQEQWAGWSHGWLTSADLQAERAVEKGLDGGEAEGQLFVLALHNAVLGAERVLGVDHPAVASFRTAAPGVTNVRDMLSHFDEYIAGDGRLQRTQWKVPNEIPAPWIVMWNGDGQDAEILVLTRNGPADARENFHASVVLKRDLLAAAELVRVAMEAAGHDTTRSALLDRLAPTGQDKS